MTRTRATDEPLQMDDDQLPVNFHIRTGERSGQQLGDIDLSKGKRVNDWGPWVAIATCIGSLALGGVIVGAIIIPELMEARAKAEAAQGEVNFRIAERETRLLREDVRQIQTQLAEQGIKIQLNSH